MCCRRQSYSLIENIKVCLYPECPNYLGITDTIKIKRNYAPLVCLISFVALLFFPIHDSESYFRVTPLPSGRNEAVSINIPPATLDNVIAEIRKAKILCSDQVYAQIRLESANLSSFLFKRTNNMLGMRYPYRRETTAIGIYLPEEDSIVYGTQKELLKYKNRLTYAAYANWIDAIKDYKLWQDQTFNIEKRYMDFLKKNYAEDPLYIDKIRVISEKVSEKSGS